MNTLTRISWLAGFSMVLGLSVTSCGGSDSSQEVAVPLIDSSVDAVVLNAVVYTDGTSASRADAFAISNGRFSYVGDSDRALAMAGDTTQIFDMGGKAILPGLIDAHVHPWQGGEKVLYMCNFDFKIGRAHV